MKNPAWQKFIHLCAQCKTKQQLNDLFAVFLTMAEQEDIAARYTILTQLLKNKKPQRAIAKELKVSIAKITRGSNAIKIASKNTLCLLKGKQ